MLRFLVYTFIFFAAFGIGWLCVPSIQLGLQNANPPPFLPAPSDTIDFFADAPSVEKSTPKQIATQMERKTFCRDRRLLPIWNTLFRDKASREVLEYSTDVTNCTDILEIEYVDLNRDQQKEILVRAVSVPSCGAVGNCDFWVLEKRKGRYRILLHGDDYWDITEMGKQVLRNSTNRYRDILLKGHLSASETSYSTYRFNGKRYAEARCRYLIPDYENSTADDTKWHFVSCKYDERSHGN